MRRPALWLGLVVVVLLGVGFWWGFARSRSAPPPSKLDVITPDERAPPLRTALPPTSGTPATTMLGETRDDLGRQGTPAPEELAQELTLARQSVVRAGHL